MVCIVPALRSGEAYRFVVEIAPRILKVHGLPIVLHWLTEVTVEAAASKTLRLRLHYERRTWPPRHDKIQGLCQTCITDIGLVGDGLISVTTNPFQNDTILDIINTEVLDHMERLMRQGLMEIRRLVSYEVQYSQCVVAEYFLKPVNDRGMVRRSLRALRTHLQTTASNIKNLLAVLKTWIVESSARSRDGFIELWQDRLGTKVANEAPFWAQATYDILKHP